ncbi:hypothetical protein QZH41_020394, partial [Actinostola sp. cb2023]
QCWSDKDGEKTYNADNSSSNCFNDELIRCKDSDSECVGGPDSNFVYQITDGMFTSVSFAFVLCSLRGKDFLVALRLSIPWNEDLKFPSTTEYKNMRQNIELKILELYGEDTDFMGQQFGRFTPSEDNNATKAYLILKFDKNGKFLNKLIDYIGAQNVSAAGECWSGPNIVTSKYAKDGPSKFCISWSSSACKGGLDCVGEDHTNFVYRVQK